MSHHHKQEEINDEQVKDEDQNENENEVETKQNDEELEVESHLRPSLLSSEAFANTENGYKGFVNLALLLLGVLNFRLVVENLIRYGLLFLSATSDMFHERDFIDWRSWPGLTVFLVNSFAAALLGLPIERAAFKRKISASTAFALEAALVAALILVPCYAVTYLSISLGSGILVMLWSTIIWMKMVSFFHVNTVVRQQLFSPSSPHRPNSPSSPHRTNSPSSPPSTRSQSPPPSTRSSSSPSSSSSSSPTTTLRSRFPEKPEKPRKLPPLPSSSFEHLTYLNLLRFFVIPSLVYEIAWAQTTKIRWAWLTRRIVEAIFLSTMIYILALQYMLPILQKSVIPLETLDIPQLLERILKLSIPLMYLWLIGFYVVFHLYLNIWAEMTYMGDRRFYDAWWNSSNLGYFWRTWNLPVHRWMLQNIYKPALAYGYSQTWAGFMCFFVSAIFHEVIVSVPFRTLKFWAFLAMLSQLPLIFITKKLFPAGSQTGNILFWCQLVLGLPTCVVMYYAYYVSTFHPLP